MGRNSNFASRLLDRSRDHPNRTALVEQGRSGASDATSCTYAQLVRRSMSFAHGLAQAGVGQRDRVVLMIAPSIESTAVYFALLALGAVPVLIDPRMGVGPLLDCVSKIEPRVVVAESRFHAMLRLMGGEPQSVRLLITKGRRWFWSGPRLTTCETSHPAAGRAASVKPGDTCLVAFTSGSTGRPKAVEFTHGMVGRQADLIAAATGWADGTRVAMCFAGFVPLTLASGLTTILPRMDFSRPGRAAPGRIVAAIRDHACESAFASPMLWRNLARHCQKSNLRLDSLQWPVTAGAPVPIDLHAILRPVIHPLGRLQTPYGATEAMPITSTVQETLDDTWEATRRGFGICVGRPVPGIEVSVIRITDDPIDRWTDHLEVPIGQLGEISVRGPIVTPGYLRDSSANARARVPRNGRPMHRTGDLGRVDEGGRVWYCGRLSQRVRMAGRVIAPSQVEAVLDQHPSVRRTALVGVGPAEDQRPVVCVEVERGARFTKRLPGELERLLDDTPWAGLVESWLPHRGFPVDVRHNSKIRREELATWAAKRLGVVVPERS